MYCLMPINKVLLLFKPKPHTGRETQLVSDLIIPSNDA